MLFNYLPGGLSSQGSLLLPMTPGDGMMKKAGTLLSQWLPEHMTQFRPFTWHEGQWAVRPQPALLAHLSHCPPTPCTQSSNRVKLALSRCSGLFHIFLSLPRPFLQLCPTPASSQRADKLFLPIPVERIEHFLSSLFIAHAVTLGFFLPSTYLSLLQYKTIQV